MLVPLDTAASFPKLVKILQSILSDHKTSSGGEDEYGVTADVAQYAVAALAHIASAVVARQKEMFPSSPDASQPTLLPDTPDVLSLKPHAETFIPALLMYIESLDIGEGRFQVGVDALSQWACIASKGPLIASVAKKLLKLLLTTTSDSLTMERVEGAQEGIIAEQTATINYTY